MTPTAVRWPLIGRAEQLEQLETALASADVDGVILSGPAGVGKTRLADEFRRRVEADGHPTSRVVASRAASRTPLGALAHLVPGDLAAGAHAVDPVAVFGRIAEALAPAERRRVLVVDDVHLLDETSFVVITQLLAGHGVFLVASVRTGESVPDGLTTLLRTDRCVTIAVHPLTAMDVDSLLHLALGGPVDAVLRSALWDLSGGVPLVLTEVVRRARESGAMIDVDGVWIQRAPLGVTARVVDLFADSIAAVGTDGRHALELLAVGGELGLAELETIAPLDSLDQLERQGLITVGSSERRRPVELAHPLVGEVVRDGLSVTRTKAVLLELVALFDGRGARRRDDALRVVGWQLAAGVAADAGLVLTAAGLARQAFDFQTVIELTRALALGAPAVDDRLRAAVLLGEALSETGAFADAEAVLAPAEQLAAGSAHGGHIGVDLAVVRSNNLFHGLLRPADAIEVRRRAAADADAEDRVLLELGEAWVTMVNGNPGAALAMIGPDAEGLSPRNRVVRSLSEGTALVFAGRTDLAFARAADAYTEHIAFGEMSSLSHPGLHVINQAMALCESGRLAEAETMATAIHQLVVDDKVVVSRVWVACTLGRIALHQGRPATARRWFREAVAISGEFTGPRRTALTGLAISAGQLGDAEPAARACKERDGSAGEFGFLAPERRLGEAWAAVAAGQPGAAREILLIGADEAAATGYRTSEALLLHDIARLGAPAEVADRLDALARECDGELIAARAAHARALTNRDAGMLAAVGDEFERLGALLCAAEAAFAAADAYRADGETRAAAAARDTGHRRAARCEGASTPGLLSVDVVVPLTTREREIAVLARDGLTSKEIAARLFLSPRTIDNHLQRIYAKLGVTNRTGLAAVLDPEGQRS